MPILIDPTDPVAAATHANPYPYYRTLLAQAPLWRDDRLGVWVAARAAAVDDVLRHPALRVRPPAEPIPKALAGSVAGDVFGRLVRMNDGAGHCPLKDVVAARLAAIRADDARAAAHRAAHALMARHRPIAGAEGLDDFILALPTRAMAHLVGIPGTRLDDACDWTHAFVDALSPFADATAIAHGKAAAEQLHVLFGQLLHDGASACLNALVQAPAWASKPPVDIIIANGIGLLTQTCEATAALIGNTLLALARHPAWRHTIASDEARMRDCVAEVTRHDAPVQNTRRFAASGATINGVSIAAGDAILVLLAAANRDGDANAAPERFDPSRTARRCWTFGAGPHACPGEHLAIIIAAAAVERLLAAGVDVDALAGHVTYARSANLRLPRFGAGTH